LPLIQQSPLAEDKRIRGRFMLWLGLIYGLPRIAANAIPVITGICLLIGCATVPPKNTENLCAVFLENQDWFPQAHQAYQRWGIPVPILMAIMRQESHFVADAKPQRRWLLGFIPWTRPSSAYGYAQALDAAWDDYQTSISDWGKDRDDFADAADFIGWYGNISYNRLGISKWDAKNLYFAYHEGHAGYRSKSHKNKKWLVRLAAKVENKAKIYQRQLSSCRLIPVPNPR